MNGTDWTNSCAAEYSLCPFVCQKYLRTQSGNENHSSEDIESLNNQDEGDTYDCNFVHW